MPRTQTAKRALRHSAIRRKKNAAAKGELKKTIKQYKKFLAEGKKEEAKKFLPQLYKKLDKSAKTNLIKKNKAARVKSRLTKLVAAK